MANPGFYLSLIVPRTNSQSPTDLNPVIIRGKWARPALEVKKYLVSVVWVPYNGTNARFSSVTCQNVS